MLSLSGLGIEGAMISSPMAFWSRESCDLATTSSFFLSIAEVWSMMSSDKPFVGI
jgi:hypothetical protein